MSKRKIPKYANPINPAAVRAFRDGDEDALYTALQLKPWQVNPLEVVAPGPPYPQWLPPGDFQAAEYDHAFDLRQRLQAAVDAEGAANE